MLGIEIRDESAVASLGSLSVVFDPLWSPPSWLTDPMQSTKLRRTDMVSISFLSKYPMTSLPLQPPITLIPLKTFTFPFFKTLPHHSRSQTNNITFRPSIAAHSEWLSAASLVHVLIEWQFVCLEPACERQVMKCALPQKRRLPGNSILFSPLFPLHARRSVENFSGRFLCKVSLENVFYWFLLSLSGFSSVFVLILGPAIAQTMLLNGLLVTHRLHAAKLIPIVIERLCGDESASQLSNEVIKRIPL